MGLSILAIGVWAWTEKDTFNNLSRLTNIALDPAFVLIVTGGLASTTSRSELCSWSFTHDVCTGIKLTILFQLPLPPPQLLSP